MSFCIGGTYDMLDMQNGRVEEERESVTERLVCRFKKNKGQIVRYAGNDSDICTSLKYNNAD